MIDIKEVLLQCFNEKKFFDRKTSDNGIRNGKYF